MSPKKKSPSNYFPIETDEAIVRFNNSSNDEVKKTIFAEEIYQPFYKLAENIIHTFKFYYTDVDDIEDLKHKIIALLLEEKIQGFDPSKGAKAYSYFGTIVKRWLINYNNTNYKKLKKKGTFEEYEQELLSPTMFVEDGIMSLSDFIDFYIIEMYSELDELFYKDTDKQIADAILTVFKKRDSVEIFKKKALYIYIREITNCKTPHLTRVVKVLKKRFYELYEKKDKVGLICREL